jgi:hypothetical protein
MFSLNCGGSGVGDCDRQGCLPAPGWPLRTVALSHMWPMQMLMLVTRCAVEAIRDRGQAARARPDELVSDGGGSEVNTHDVVEGGGTNVELNG